MKQFIICTVILAALCLSKIDAANYCYSCSGCSVPFNYTGNSTCYAGYADTCMKIYVSVPASASSFFSGTLSPTVSRSCVPSAACIPFSLLVLGYGFSMSCCTNNLCNSAETAKMTMTTLMIPLLVALFYLRK